MKPILLRQSLSFNLRDKDKRQAFPCSLRVMILDVNWFYESSYVGIRPKNYVETKI